MSHELNAQGFVIVGLNPRSATFMQKIDAAFMFELNGCRISVSTGGVNESGGCAQEIFVHNIKTNKDFFVPDSVENVINSVIAGEFNG